CIGDRSTLCAMATPLAKRAASKAAAPRNQRVDLRHRLMFHRRGASKVVTGRRCRRLERARGPSTRETILVWERPKRLLLQRAHLGGSAPSRHPSPQARTRKGRSKV